MSEQEFEQKLLVLIRQLKEEAITTEQFVETAQELAKNAAPKQLNDFKDEDVGWAKYWVEEISYYGFDEVMNNRFNFFKFLERRSE